MATENRRVPYARVEGFTHNQIQGISATTPGNPFREGHIPEFSVVRVKARKKNGSPIREVTNYHRRSFEYGKGVIWEDQYGNLFSSVNIKGNNCYDPKIFASGSAPSGFLPDGLQEGDALVRILKTSELLRSQNIDTEAIVKVIEPAELIFGKDLVSQDEYKARLIRGLWQKSGKSSKIKPGDIQRTDIPKLAKALENMVFFFTVRGVQVSERIIDLYQAKSYEDLKRILAKAFAFVNLDEKRKSKLGVKWYKQEYFSIDNPADVKRYLLSYLPKKLARNFYAMHQEGIIQNIGAHYGNNSTVGGIHDLDTARGEPLGLGDRKMDVIDFANDMAELTNETINQNSKVLQKIDPEFSLLFTRELLTEYLRLSKLDVLDLREIFGPEFEIKPEDYSRLMMVDSVTFAWLMVQGFGVPDELLKLETREEIFKNAFTEYIFEKMVYEILKKRKESHAHRDRPVYSQEVKAIRGFASILAMRFMERITGEVRGRLDENETKFTESLAEADPHKHPFIRDASKKFYQGVLARYRLDKNFKYDCNDPGEFFDRYALSGGRKYKENIDVMLKSAIRLSPKPINQPKIITL